MNSIQTMRIYVIVSNYFPCFCFLRFDVKAGVAREESRSPQRVLFDVATANPMMVDEMLDVLFETIANELSDDVKLVWLFRLAHRGWEDKEKFRSLLHKVSLDLVGF